MRILYVEDNPELRETIGMLMESEGRTVTSCATAEEALELDARENFDVLVSDVSLPGLSGTDLARKVLEADAQRWVTAHQQIAAREATGDYLGATRVAIGTDPGSAAVAYRSLDGHLTAAIDRARTLYRDNVNTARFAIAFSGPGAFILCVLAAAGVAAGFYPRVREYR